MAAHLPPPPTDPNLTEQVNRFSGRLSPHFDDFLRTHHHFSDTWWLLTHQWHSTQFEGSRGRSPNQIAQDVFTDPVIESLLQSDPSVRDQISSILSEMAHSFSINPARLIYFFIMKVMKSTYEHVFVENRLGNASNSLHSSLNALARTSRIVFLPNHRSYADYLGYSFLSFSQNIPIPTLATGRNLLSMNVLVSLLRCCGAFFIRRNFQSDQLYWKVFRAYVRSQVIGGEHPFAFYLEGTRSRTGKSYYPKIGALKTIVELVLRAQVEDVTLVPLVHSYDRVLEEEVYARELTSGYAKPNENVLNLMRGIRQIVSQHNGSAYVRFCEPISVRQVLQSTDEYRRMMAKHSSDNRKEELVLTLEENRFVLDLAKRVLLSQNASTIVSSFNLVAIIILSCHFQRQSPTCSNGHSKQVPSANLTFPLHDLLNDLSSLALLIPDNLSTSVNRLTIQQDLIRALKVHSNLVRYEADKEMVTVHLDRPLVQLQLQMYANQAMQLLIDHAVYLFTSGVKSHFDSIRFLLGREFICLPGDCDHTFNKAAQSLKGCEASLEPNRITLSKRSSSSLQVQVHYYLSSYRRIVTFLANLLQSVECEKTSITLKHCHSLAKKELQISGDLIQNTLTVLMERGCLVEGTNVSSTSSSSNIRESASVQINQCAVQNFVDQLTSAMDVNKNLLQCQ